MEAHHASIARELCENVTLIAQYWEDLLEKLNNLEERVETIISLLRKSEGQMMPWTHKLSASCSTSNISSVGTGLFISGLAGAMATSGASLGLTVAGCFLIGAGVINAESIVLCHDQDHLKRELKLLSVYCENAKLSCENFVELSKDLEERISGKSRTMLTSCKKERTREAKLSPYVTDKQVYYSIDQNPQPICEIRNNFVKPNNHSVSWESYCNASEDFTRIKEIVPVLESLSRDICALVINEVSSEAIISKGIACHIQMLNTLKQKITLTRKCIMYKMKLEANSKKANPYQDHHHIVMQEMEDDVQTSKNGITRSLQTYFNRKLKEAEDRLQSLQNQMDLLQNNR